MELTTKQKLILATYELIREVGIENVKVREVAKRVGCTPAALYKHFDSFDYLIMVASLRFLDDYMTELQDLTESGGNAIQVDFAAWRAFNRRAFQNPPMFIHLFWGPTSHLFENASSEYFECFPVKAGQTRTAFFFTAAFTGSIQERDFIWLRRAASEGYLLYDDAKYISQINSYTVFGMLNEHLKDYMLPGVAEKAAEECNHLIETTIQKFMIKYDL